MQKEFIALYRGQTVADASLVAVTADDETVSEFRRRLETNPPRTVIRDEGSVQTLRLVRGGEDEGGEDESRSRSS